MANKRILVATEKPFAPAAVEQIRSIAEENGFELKLLEKYTEKSQLLEAVADVAALIVRSDKIDEEVLKAGKELKVVVRAGAGYDNIDTKAATELGICVQNTPGQNSNAVAELVFALLLYHMRKHFTGKSGSELMGKRFGIMSYGNIGHNAARIAKGFGMEVYGFQRLTPVNYAIKDGFKFFNDRKLMFSLCDIMMIAMPSAPNTKGMINYDLMSQMPENAILVNIARKDLINEDDLVRILEERPDITYLTDLKPDRESEILERFPDQYFSTDKKLGAQTAEANINAGLAATKQICTFLQTGQARYRVN
ncbi:MAG: NAD(P)-dependent oxidoreductase [Porphyromonas sp.]|nr:NAD(P)-dependent oxidoreductase [Porphyromonas sp.]